MAANLKPKTKEEERKLEIANHDAMTKAHVAPDIAERRKNFAADSPSTAPSRPPPPRPVAVSRGKKKKNSATSTDAGATKGAAMAAQGRSENGGIGGDRGEILDNSAAAVQPRRSLSFAKKKNSSSSEAEKSKKHTSGIFNTVPTQKSTDPGNRGTILEVSGDPEQEGESSGSDDDGVIVEWKDEDSSEFSSIKATDSRFATMIREKSPPPAGSALPSVRMSNITQTTESSPPTVAKSNGVTSPMQVVAPLVAAPSPAPAAAPAPTATPRDSGTTRSFSKRKTVRKEEPAKSSAIANLPATLPLLESTEASTRFRTYQELYSTEYSYVKNLEVLVEVYKSALKSVLSSKDLDCVFMNVESIYEFNTELLEELYKRYQDWDEKTTTIGDAFTSTAARFNVYSVYCANHRDAEEAVARLKRKGDVHDALQAANQDARVTAGLNLQSHMLTPVQRMPRYLLLLQNILKRTPDDHPDFPLLREAIGKLDHITEHVNQHIREVQNQKALSDLRTQVVGLDAHDLPGRKLAKEGQVCLTSIRKLYQCILFNDLIVFALRGETKGKVELALDLSTVWVHDLGNDDPQTTSQDAIEIYNPDRPYTIYVKTVNEKRHWLNEIRRIIQTHLKQNSDNLEAPSDLEARTGIAMDADGQSQSAVVRASDIVHRRAKFSYANGELYDGCWLDAMRHGEGEMTWRDRTTYMGSWVENERVGEGTLTYNTAEVYSGAWRDDVQRGKGTLKLCSGDLYDGEWHGGLPQGDGKLIYANGDEFDGSFDRATIHGDGVLKCKNGVSYDGQWMESQFDGEGKYTNRYGDKFEGELVHNCFHGAGLMQYADGSTYDGIWEKGHRHGFGCFKEPGGAEFNGNWRLDQRHGQGYQRFKDGSMYDGHWEYSMRHGQGKMRFANGDEYSGAFKHNHVHGHGTMSYSDGAVYIGDFKFGQRHGYGVMEYANSGHYDGNWVHDAREGEGTYAYDDEVYTGDFAHDRPHGKGTYTHRGSNTMYTGQYVAGRRCGPGVETSPWGKYNGEWKYGMRHGAGKEVSTVGTISEGTWHCNQRNGVFAVRSVIGEVTEVCYQAGALVGEAKAHDVPNMPLLLRTMM